MSYHTMGEEMDGYIDPIPQDWYRMWDVDTDIARYGRSG